MSCSAPSSVRLQNSKMTRNILDHNIAAERSLLTSHHICLWAVTLIHSYPLELSCNDPSRKNPLFKVQSMKVENASISHTLCHTCVCGRRMRKREVVPHSMLSSTAMNGAKSMKDGLLKVKFSPAVDKPPITNQINY